MITHELTQGTDAWHAHRAKHFNASDAPAMMGVSPHVSRSELVRRYATGQVADIDPATQKRFDDGHRFEALAMKLAEEIIGESLYQQVGTLGKLSASFDGLTMDESKNWEHKTMNDRLRSLTNFIGQELPIDYRVQMEQQHIVSGAEISLFMASNWTEDNIFIEERHCWYSPDLELRQQIIAGWEQFEIDVANYQHVEAVPVATGTPVKDLPAIVYKLDGLALTSNLEVYRAAAEQLVEDSKAPLETDQDFSDRDVLNKKFGEAEKRLETVRSQVIGEIQDVDAFCRELEHIQGLIRQARLNGERAVKAEKDNRRNDIVQQGVTAFAEHMAGLNKRLGSNLMPVIHAEFSGVVRGLKSLDSMRDKVSTELARCKIEANQIADRIGFNQNALLDFGGAHLFLFYDKNQLLLKNTDDLIAVIKSRIAEHNADEEKRLVAERERIREEEREKAAAAAIPVAAAPTLSQVVHAAAPAPVAQAIAPRAVTSLPTLRLGQIGERLGFNLTADFIRTLGFEPAQQVKSALLYNESDFGPICIALMTHINTVAGNMFERHVA